MQILVTGTAGFIGFHVARRLLSEGHQVVGFDGMTPYYDVSLKEARHAQLMGSEAFRGEIGMLEDRKRVSALVETCTPDVIVHLAAQAGVRYSLENPQAYIDSNIVGTYNIIEAAKSHRVKHLLLASTSSVYGANEKVPFREIDQTDHPMTLYAATKKSTENMGHAYAHLWKIPTTALRFFTVYGPWGRPDMALFKFVKCALAREPIEVFGHGRMQRDFTYVGDLVEVIARLIHLPPEQGRAVSDADSISTSAPFRTLNIGRGQPVELLEFVKVIERTLGVAVKRRYLDAQKGDVPTTAASTDLQVALTGAIPMTSLDAGVSAFVEWYRDYYRV